MMKAKLNVLDKNIVTNHALIRISRLEQLVIAQEEEINNLKKRTKVRAKNASILYTLLFIPVLLLSIKASLIDWEIKQNDKGQYIFGARSVEVVKLVPSVAAFVSFVAGISGILLTSKEKELLSSRIRTYLSKKDAQEEDSVSDLNH